MDKTRVLVFGSCVSRDAFELVENIEGRFVVVDYFARSSFASLAFPKMVNQEVLERVVSPFQKRMVFRDMNKCFFERLAIRDYDFILVDLIDDRFNIVGGSGGGVTYSNELRAAMRPKKPACFIRSGSKDYIELWERGASKVFDLIFSLGLERRVFINKVFWSELPSGKSFDSYPCFLGSGQANEYLASRYSFLERHFGVDGLDYGRDLFVSDFDHKWGCSPFHYVNDFYKETIRCLTCKVNNFGGGRG